MGVIATIFVERWDEGAVDLMSARGNEIIDEVPLRPPIFCVLFDGLGGELARFALGSADPTDQTCPEIEAEMRSQNGASLLMTDRDGVTAEVVMIVGAYSKQ